MNKFYVCLSVLCLMINLACGDQERELRGHWVAQRDIKESLRTGETMGIDTFIFFIDNSFCLWRERARNREALSYDAITQKLAMAQLEGLMGDSIENIAPFDQENLDELDYYRIQAGEETIFTLVLRHVNIDSFYWYESGWGIDKVTYQRIYTSLWGVE